MPRQVDANDVMMLGQCSKYRIPPAHRTRSSMEKEQRRFPSRSIFDDMNPSRVVVVDNCMGTVADRSVP